MPHSLRPGNLYLLDLSTLELDPDEPEYIYATLQDVWEVSEGDYRYNFYLHIEEINHVCTQEELEEINVIPATQLERWVKRFASSINVAALLEARDRYLSSTEAAPSRAFLPAIVSITA